MNNNNIADISMFETLQADQHNKTGMSQMAVFNADLKALQTAGEDCIKASQIYKKAKEEYGKASSKYQMLVSLNGTLVRAASSDNPDDPKAKEEADEYSAILKHVSKNTIRVV